MRTVFLLLSGSFLIWTLSLMFPGQTAASEPDMEKYGMTTKTAQSANPALKDIYLAGGCFWGVEEYFSRIAGVTETGVGYANGKTANPDYREVCSGDTGHAETVFIRYDPAMVSLTTLLEQFFKIINPVSLNRQGNDVGTQYRTGIYYVDGADAATARAVMDKIAHRYDRPLAVELKPLDSYYPAEEYHQKYLKKNPGGYCHINFDSLKDLPAPEAVHKKTEPSAFTRPSEEELKKRLSPIAFEVTQRSGTERPFTGQYWDSKESGIYVDIVSGEPLFTSADKFDSGCGWPSFTKPVAPQALVEKQDDSHGMRRIEVRSGKGDSHLGHVFDDGPRDRGGLRYCINSAALRFIPYADMDKEGFGAYKHLVKP